jgi:hypothetical protein
MASIAAVGVLISLSPASGQESLHFNAEVGADGKITLVPAPEDAGKSIAEGAPTTAPGDQQGESVDPKLSADQLSDFFKSGAAADAYVQYSPTAIKGIYVGKEAPPAAWMNQMQLGDTIAKMSVSKLTSASGSSWGLSEEQMQEIAATAARQMLSAARTAACGMTPLPATITPTVEVSFSLFAGGSFSVSATWNTAEICKSPQ